MTLKDPWYQDGLRFGCTECGACCTGSPGYVWLSEEDIETLCQALQLQRHEFLQRYTRLVHLRTALIEHPKTYDCVFLKGNRCEVYSARPKQCRTFPWWPEHLSSPEEWKKAAERCEGINHPDGKLFSPEEIDQ